MRDLISRFDGLLDILAGASIAVGFARDPVVEERDNQFGGLSVGIRYSDGSELHVEIWADCSQEHPVWTSYRIQYQDARAACRFRYDNADHHAQLSNFPHHLHAGHALNERLYPLGPPGPRQIVKSIGWCLAHPGELWEPLPPSSSTEQPPEPPPSPSTGARLLDPERPH